MKASQSSSRRISEKVALETLSMAEIIGYQKSTAGRTMKHSVSNMFFGTTKHRPRPGLPRSILILVLFFSFALSISAAEKLPPAPTRYFNDYASLVRSDVAEQLNRQLADFERQTSNQILVAIYPKFPSETSLEDYTQQVARSWKAGTNGRDNAAILFVFVQDRKIRIEVGRDLEGALPDITCKQIISEQIAPRFRQGDFAGGISAGITAIMAATKGEYKGTGMTVRDRRSQAAHGSSWIIPVVFLLIFLVFFMISVGRRGGMIIGGGGGGPWFGGGGFGGGGFGGGGGSSGGSSRDDGFSGGGGDSGFGGGGASGDW
jgi:uncharacterized protein